MKRFILASLSVLLLSAATAPDVKAESTALNPAVANTSSTVQLKPFNLVYLAYQGYFRREGIPSYASLITAYRTGQISALDIIQSAVNANRLPSEVLTNRAYISAVETQLNFLQTH